MAYKQITGKFAEDFDQLIAFIDNSLPTKSGATM